MRRLFLPLTLNIFLFAVSLCAQSPEDILLSHDPHDSTLVSDLRIQAALEHGGHRLAVWGTQVALGDSVVGALVMNLDGVQKILTSEEVRPYGAVDIVPMGSEDFLVVWNDRRSGGGGIYGSMIRSGPVGSVDEIWLDSTGWFIGDVSSRSLGSGIQLFISRIDGTERSARMIDVVDASGGSPGASVPVADTVIAPYGSFPLDAERYLMMLANGDAIVIDADGSIDTDPIPDDRMLHPHWIDDDDGITVYRNDTLLHYPSIGAVLPDSIRHISAGTREFSAVHRDTNGLYLIAHTYRSEQDGYGVYRLRTYFSFSDTAIIRRDTMVLTGVTVPRSASLCGSTFTTDVRYHGRNLIEVIVNLSLCYDRNGSSTTDTTGVRKAYLLGDSAARYNGLLPYVRRLSDHAKSGIRIDWARPPIQRIDYYAVIAPKQIDVSHFFPSVISSEGFSVSWFSSDRRVGGVMIDDVTGPIVAYPYLPLTVAEAPVDLTNLTLQSSRPGVITSSFYQSTTETSYDVFVTRSTYRPRCYLPVPSMGLALIGPGAYDQYNGSDNPGGGGGRSDRYHSLQFDPNRREITGMVTFDYGTTSSVAPSPQNFFTFRTDDNIQATSWSWNLKRPVLGFVPIDPASVYLLVTHDTLLRAQANQPLGQKIGMRSVDTSLRERTILVQRLFGERLLRLTQFDSSESLTLEVYGFDGRVQGQRSLQNIGPSSSFSVAENPIDSSVVLVVAGANGVAAITLGTQLQIAMQSNGQVLGARWVGSTEEPASWVACAIDAEGRLFAAWERKKGDASEIVGNWWPIPGDLDFPGTGLDPSDPSDPSTPFDPFDPGVVIPFTPQPSLKITFVAPNPLYRIGMLRIEAALNENARVSFVNARGEIVHSTPLNILEGTHLYPLDLSTIESGAYTLQVVGQSGRDDMNVIVVGE